MGWLRKERDLIGLVAVWTILLQSIILPFTSGLHAAALLSGTEGTVFCSSRGAGAARELPGPNHRKPDCPCCHMSCRNACGSAHGGILPTEVRVPLPSSAVITVAAPRVDAPALRSARHRSAQPRAPPLA
jgi:hypothetical protein